MSNQSSWIPPIVTIDVVLFTIVDEHLKVAVLPRDKAPHQGQNALIGGFVHTEEDKSPTDAAKRILLEKAGLRNIFIEQLYTFGGADRDERGWSISIAYYALVPHEKLAAQTKGLQFVDAEDPGALPFDHNEIVRTAIGRIRGKGAYSTLPARLLPETFTLPELISIYRIVTASKIDQSSFRRKMMEMSLLESVPEAQKSGDPGRKAALFRLRPGLVSEFDRKI